MGQVAPGDPLTIKAADWNVLLGVADDARMGRLGAPRPGGYGMSGGGVLVPMKNSTGADLARYHAMGVGAPVYTPTDNLQTFKNQLVLTGQAASSTYLGKWAIAQESIAIDKIGLALLQGVTVAEITVGHDDHDRVDVDTAGGSKLVSQFYGAGEILYKESGTGTKWAIIRIGAFVSEQLKAVAVADIPANFSGDVTVWRGGVASQTVTAYLNWLCGTEGVDADLELLIRFFRDENRYVIEAAECV
jgi:hypothetical protein